MHVCLLQHSILLQPRCGENAASLGMHSDLCHSQTKFSFRVTQSLTQLLVKCGVCPVQLQKLVPYTCSFTLGFCFSRSLVKWQPKLLLKKLAKKQNSASSHQVNPSAFTSTPPIILLSCPGNALFVSMCQPCDGPPTCPRLTDKFDSCLQVSNDTSSKNCKQTPALHVSG